MRWDVCFWHKADITTVLSDVRFEEQSGRPTNRREYSFVTHCGQSALIFNLRP